MSNPVPDGIKRNVRAVLLSKVGGVPLTMFIKDYKNLVLEQLDFRGLGFETLQAFLKSMPEIARLEKNGPEIKAFGVGDPDTYLPVGARKAQGKLPKDYHKKLKAGPEAQEESPSTDMEHLSDLEIDHCGWYSLCCPLEKAPSSDKDELETIFLQAGSPVLIHLTSRWVFIRYKTKEECSRAFEVFGEEYNLRIASNKKPQQNGSADENSNHKPAQRPGRRANGPKLGRDRTKDSGYATDTDIIRQQQKSGKKLNGHLPKIEPHENGFRKQKAEVSDKSLYVYGITDEDAFRKLVEPYKPEHIRLVSHQSGWLGYLDMRTAEEAKTAIAELNRKQLGEKYIIVDYHTPKEGKHDKSKRDTKSSSFSEKESQQTHPKKNKKSPQKPREPETSETPSDFENMPPLMQENPIAQGPNTFKSPQKSSGHKISATPTEVADIPPLVQESSFGHNPQYYIDCTVYVGNFPPNTTYLTLHEAFSKYHVRDIIIGNTSKFEGCTRAFLYLSSIYDVVECVKEMNGHIIDGCTVKVDVPYKNEKMRFILKNRLHLRMLRT